MELNRDYYITFRSRDYAGISNPTAIFKYRLSDYNGIYHELEEYFLEPPPAIDGIPFNRALNIRVAGEQSYINFEGAPQYGDLSNNVREGVSTSRGTEGLVLGPTAGEGSLWGRRFCFEIESTVSGRRIRICVEYNQSRTNNSGETESIRAYLESIGLGPSLIEHMRAGPLDICAIDSGLDGMNRRINAQRLTDQDRARLDNIVFRADTIILSPEDRSRAAQPAARIPLPNPPRPPEY